MQQKRELMSRLIIREKRTIPSFLSFVALAKKHPLSREFICTNSSFHLICPAREVSPLRFIHVDTSENRKDLVQRLHK